MGLASFLLVLKNEFVLVKKGVK